MKTLALALLVAASAVQADPPTTRRDPEVRRLLVEANKHLREANAVASDIERCRNKGRSKLRYSYAGGSTLQPECGAEGVNWVHAGEPRAAVTFLVPMPPSYAPTLPACVSVESRIYCEDLACQSGVLDIERAVCTNKIHIRSHR